MPAPQPSDARKFIVMGVFLVIGVAFGALLIKALTGGQSVGAPEPGQNLGEPWLGKIHSFRITMPARAIVGDNVLITITAINEFGRPVTGYSGVVSIKSDLLPLPKKTKYLPGDRGTIQFRVKLQKGGVDIIEVTDPVARVSVKSQPITIEGSKP